MSRGMAYAALDLSQARASLEPRQHTCTSIFPCPGLFVLGQDLVYSTRIVRASFPVCVPSFTHNTPTCSVALPFHRIGMRSQGRFPIQPDFSRTAKALMSPRQAKVSQKITVGPERHRD